ncbi:M48 family metallopeptidase [Acholeplasma hippikon]|uniref:Protein of uncharacterized function DUF45 n=1 Tax=Acholeplasma hippikon TaxID=264636 RepID=A0A449BJG8_9MOLU|nr:M48 family metallopeptidase [Acholeplasma hippikon]VEU82592.1 Protein of uncharacterised function DUF45 [Acholeplasma hippikon]
MFQRKNKVLSGTYEKRDISLSYEIHYKKIKHIYFRFKNNVLVVTANERLSKENIIYAIDINFDKILKLKNKKQSKVEVKKYQLWGKELSIDVFFDGLAQTEKNMFEIYKNETLKMIETLTPNLVNDLNKLGLTLVPIIVKPLKTKYGSCQIYKKTITINSFLAKLDPIYLYYVLLHEYCHLLVPNHQAAFYKKLDLVMKNHKQVQKSLRKHTIMF